MPERDAIHQQVRDQAGGAGRLHGPGHRNQRGEQDHDGPVDGGIDRSRRDGAQRHRRQHPCDEGDGGRQQAQGSRGDGRQHDRRRGERLALVRDAQLALGQRHAAEVGSKLDEGFGRSLHQQQIARSDLEGAQARLGAGPLARDRQQIEPESRTQQDVAGGASGKRGLGSNDELHEGDLVGTFAVGAGLARAGVRRFVGGLGATAPVRSRRGTRRAAMALGVFVGGIVAVERSVRAFVVARRAGFREFESQARQRTGQGVHFGLEHEDVAGSHDPGGIRRGQPDVVAH